MGTLLQAAMFERSRIQTANVHTAKSVVVKYPPVGGLHPLGPLTTGVVNGCTLTLHLVSGYIPPAS